jgi:hypothetical protein
LSATVVDAPSSFQTTNSVWILFVIGFAKISEKIVFYSKNLLKKKHILRSKFRKFSNLRNLERKMCLFYGKEFFEWIK